MVGVEEDGAVPPRAGTRASGRSSRLWVGEVSRLENIIVIYTIIRRECALGTYAVGHEVACREAATLEATMSMR